MIFFNILNKIWTSSHTIQDIDIIIHSCLKPSPLENTMLCLFYTNTKTMVQYKKIFKNTNDKTFWFLMQDIHSNTCPSHFKLSN
jgi:hypothetical protein